MARYRKIDPRTWNDERIAEADPFHKLAWFALLTHPLMTPMGAGIFPAEALAKILGWEGRWCWACQEMANGCPHEAETILRWFAQEKRILRDKDLVVVRNFLPYNCPQNPNQLVGWIAIIEELPRSRVFGELRDYLQNGGFDLPVWLFRGLLDPLAEEKMRGLRDQYWSRIRGVEKGSRQRSGQGSLEGLEEPSGVDPLNIRAGMGTGSGVRAGAGAPPYSPPHQGDQARGTVIKGLAGFDEFWSSYPQKEGRGKAEEAWRKHPQGARLEDVLAGIEKWRGSKKWAEGFIPLPATWLNQKRWKDDPVPVSPLSRAGAATLAAGERVIQRLKDKERKGEPA